MATARRLQDVALSTRIPYTAHVAPGIVRTQAGDYITAFRLGGASFETADEETLNSWHERLNVLWRNLATPHVAFWAHLVRRCAHGYPAGECPPGFAAELNRRYREHLSRQTLMVNEWTLTLVYRPQPTQAGALTLRALTRRDPATELEERTESIDVCTKLADHLRAGLARYDPEPLRLYRYHNRPCSELLEFLAQLVNGEHQRIPLPRSPLADVLATSRLLFGREAVEIRTPTRTRLAAALGVKEYPTPTTPGMLNALLSAPYPLVLSQSFTCLSRAAAQGLLQRQVHRMGNAGDFAHSQAEELHTALDQLSSNVFAMGQHHLSLLIQTDPMDVGTDTEPRQALRQLNDRISHARALLSDAGFIVAREDLALEAAYWAQLPGNFPARPRHAPISTRNWSAFAPFHNYPAGRADGNTWGEAMTVLTTPSHSPFYFSFHARRGARGGEGGDVGHTLLCGPTGSGKTVLIGFLIAMLQKHHATQIVFDKDQGLEILIRALGGEYRAIANGAPTLFNPLQLEPTGANLEFLRLWLRTLLGREPLLTTSQSADLDQALHGTLQLTPSARRLSRLMEFLDPTESEGIYARLSPWCASTEGDYAWAFDHPEDRIAHTLRGPSAPLLMGFDVTAFLDNPTLRTPITLYLFHLVRQLLDGRRLVCWLDEFWKLLADPAFEVFAKEGPKTWRKLNALMCFATQSASDVLASPISRTIVEQTATQIFFPNPQAQAVDYCDGFGLSAREFRLVREGLEPGAHAFLVKQGHHSLTAALDLSNLAAEVAVISGRAQTLAIARRLMAECGPEPQHWLPVFMQAIEQPAFKSNQLRPQELP